MPAPTETQPGCENDACQTEAGTARDVTKPTDRGVHSAKLSGNVRAVIDEAKSEFRVVIDGDIRPDTDAIVEWKDEVVESSNSAAGGVHEPSRSYGVSHQQYRRYLLDFPGGVRIYPLRIPSW